MVRGSASYRSASAMGYRQSTNGEGYSSNASRYGSSRSGGTYGMSSSSNSRYGGQGSGQGGGISFEDEGYSSDATAQQGRSGTGTGGTDSSSSNADAAGWRAAESMARAVESSSNTEQKATVLSTSHGQSLLEIAEAIKNGTANDSDAQALIACAERLRSFANTCTRTSEKVGEAKDAMEDHHDALAAAESTGGGGADSEEVKSYSLESARAGASGGRHTGRYRSGGYSQAGSTGRGEGGISRSASRAMGF